MSAREPLHLTDEQIDHYADAVMGDAERASADAHLASCDPLPPRARRARARYSPRRRGRAAIAVPADLWPLVASSTIHLAAVRRAVLRLDARVCSSPGRSRWPRRRRWSRGRSRGGLRRRASSPPRAPRAGTGPEHAGHPVAPTARCRGSEGGGGRGRGGGGGVGRGGEVRVGGGVGGGGAGGWGSGGRVRCGGGGGGGGVGGEWGCRGRVDAAIARPALHRDGDRGDALARPAEPSRYPSPTAVTHRAAPEPVTVATADHSCATRPPGDGIVAAQDAFVRSRARRASRPPLSARRPTRRRRRSCERCPREWSTGRRIRRMRGEREIRRDRTRVPNALRS